MHFYPVYFDLCSTRWFTDSLRGRPNLSSPQTRAGCSSGLHSWLVHYIVIITSCQTLHYIFGGKVTLNKYAASP